MGLPLVALLAVAAVALSGGGQGGGQDASRPAAPEDPRREAGGGAQSAGLGTPALGSKDAPVVLTEHSDYQ